MFNNIKMWGVKEVKKLKKSKTNVYVGAMYLIVVVLSFHSLSLLLSPFHSIL